VRGPQDIAIEVKGMKTAKGQVLFTDLEWRTARCRASSFWLVVVGSLPDAPVSRLWKDPANSIVAKSSVSRVVSLHWRADVAVA
jgi:hypothetical protein